MLVRAYSTSNPCLSCSSFNVFQRRFASTLVVADHDNVAVSPATLSTITAAGKLGGATVLIAGHGCAKAAEHAGMY